VVTGRVEVRQRVRGGGRGGRGGDVGRVGGGIDDDGNGGRT